MVKVNDDLTLDFVREALCYSEATGDLIWKQRPRTHFRTTNGWRVTNTQKAGKIAGCVSSGPIQVRLKNKLYLAHRLAWLLHYGRWPKTADLDHINGNSKDNRIANLREATHRQNSYNRGKNKNNTSGYKGVAWHGQNKKWRAVITHKGKYRLLGLFDCKEDAYKAYIHAAKKLHGSFIKVT